MLVTLLSAYRVVPMSGMAECEIIVKKTILEGKVLHELLRGGLGLANRASVVEW